VNKFLHSVPDTKSQGDPALLEQALLERTTFPVAHTWIEVEVDTSWYNHPVIWQMRGVAKQRWGIEVVVVEQRKLLFLRRRTTLRAYGPAWALLVWNEALAAW